MAIDVDGLARSLNEVSLHDPFAVLGMHQDGQKQVVRCFIPWAETVNVLDKTSGDIVGPLFKADTSGLFQGAFKRAKRFAYQLKVTSAHGEFVIDDPYSFGPVMGELDIYLLAEGTHIRSFEKLGAHATSLEGVDGVSFAVWAPSARAVSVVGSFNDWDARRNPMRLHASCGVWDIFLPGVEAGAAYKFQIRGADGDILPLKADPYANQMEFRPATASLVATPRQHEWQDQAWLKERWRLNSREAAISVYEVHLGSWRRHLDGNRYYGYRELADELVPYVKDMGFTHLEVLPVSEFPFDGSWGYQPVGIFAPTSRFGSPDDFRYFVDACHQAGIALLIDWVPGHFPTDVHGLAKFDGTFLYEHADPRQGFHRDWNTLIFNYGRREISNYLISNALYWMEEFHIDGLRVDAVASMLYLDYSRNAGEWVPNQFGGRENIEAIDFLRRTNELVFREAPGGTTIAEESTSWPMVSAPTYLGGLGFGFKWNMGWMHDTLAYMAHDPIHRRYHHNNLTFGLLYGFSENFVLPLSHDEVVHGKKSIIGRMPGDHWQRFANLRAYYGFMWAHPGKKLLFMGCEFGQEREWNFDQGLDWQLLDDPMHRGVQDLVRDLNKLYRAEPSLHALDAVPEGFQWIDSTDSDQSCLSFLRKGTEPHQIAVVVCNFTPVPRHGYRIGVPRAGRYLERVNTDAGVYGGSNLGNNGSVESQPVSWHGQPDLLSLTLPPLSTMIFTYDGETAS